MRPRGILLQEAGFDVVGQADNANDLLALVAEHQPDVVIADIRMPPSHTLEGLEAAKIIRARYPAVGVLVLSQFVEPHYAMQLIDNAEQEPATFSRTGLGTSKSWRTPYDRSLLVD